MTRTEDTSDPKGLIREAYRIEGIGAAECRSIFLDWALSLPEGLDQAQALRALHMRFAADHPDHPMTEVLRQGLGRTDAPRRRGGWRSRPRG
ncbi:hypothetical protein SAMN05444007_101298 [Cribrihabitans marinus]|uniref:Uncharacterized protein n=1 Tax=Cribrihabitans marinus TaxID=1227549 RepID=A0A1H6R6C2_9RHOB|nr:hypothetical protein [Cribrihabitans marinus]GGH19866.1 hypothetical protein GCM10010973_03440 [Cribrihabitans marinus]SEI47165.1 hypothetical protein SAMN05444007_101298 [Cribrihabitans marinus]